MASFLNSSRNEGDGDAWVEFIVGSAGMIGFYGRTENDTAGDNNFENIDLFCRIFFTVIADNLVKRVVCACDGSDRCFVQDSIWNLFLS